MYIMTEKLEKDRADLLEIIEAYRKRIEAETGDIHNLRRYITAHIVRLGEINDELRNRYVLSDTHRLNSETETVEQSVVC